MHVFIYLEIVGHLATLKSKIVAETKKIDWNLKI